MKLKRSRLLYYLIPILAFLFTINGCNNNQKADIFAMPTKVPYKGPFYYGLRVDSLEIHKDIIRPNAYLADILLNNDVEYSVIHKITENSKDVFNFRRIKAGQPYSILKTCDTLQTPEYFIYDQNAYQYVICKLSTPVKVYLGEKPVETVIKTASGEIQSSLYLTLDEYDIHPTLALSLADIYAWTVDFYRLNKGDKFKVVYEERFVEDKSLGVNSIKAATFTHFDKEIFANQYQLSNDSIPSYFDEEGGSLQKTFLKSPLKFGRLSSKYSGRRFHPVQKRYKAHRGTDYAAPTGTPIRATADGVVVEATYKKYNGNYIKVQHNSTYTTQYLHMSKFAKGVKHGKHVQQGETIGYVGSTGLATGPHVCYRFWKNGAQIDHTREEVPPSDPVPSEELDAYLKHFDSVRIIVDQIEYPEILPSTYDTMLISSDVQ